MTTTTKTAPASTEALLAARWSGADTLLWCYLFLPVPIFLAGFFRPALGLPLAALACAGAVHFVPRRPAAFDRSPPPVADWMLLALLAALWTALGGAGHLFHANGIDWVPRFAVLRDLVVESWPPRYGKGPDASMLRAPLAYYLPPALLAKAATLTLVDVLLLSWTWLGVTLFFCANLGGTRNRKLGAALVFAFASGLDVLGLLLREGSLPWPTQHIEWWAGSLQYSSNSTLLLWVPNHGLPGWIAGAWLWRFRDDANFLARLPMIFLPLMLWSPLVAIGLLPLALVAMAARLRGSRDCLRPAAASLVLLALPGALVAAYLLLGMFGGDPGANAMTPTAPIMQQPASIPDRLLFVILEAGVFCVFLLRRERSPLAWATVGVLLLLPWTRFGPNNDLAMRASIPALTILWLVLAEELSARHAADGAERPWRFALLALFMLGAITPLQEFHRALAGHAWQADTGISAPRALGGFVPHYFVSERRNWLGDVMRR